MDGTAGTSTCRRSAPGSATAFASTARGTPEGQRCNPSKLLLDPYAKAIDGEVDWTQACFGYDFGDDDSRNDDDSAPHVPKSVVHSPYFDWANDRPPGTPLHETIIYEVHVKGFTATHPEIPEPLRGTYAALAHPAAIDYLRDLGVTAVELMPVHQFVHDSYLVGSRPRELLGLQLDRLLRAAQRLRVGWARRAGAGVQGDGPARCTRRASR